MSNRTHVSRLVAEWEQSGVQSKQVAAWLALSLRNQQPGTVVQSREKIAAEYGVHTSTAQRARLLVQSTGIAYKTGKHLYVSETARELDFVAADDDTYSDIWIDHLWQVHAELAREKVIRYLTDDGQEARATTVVLDILMPSKDVRRLCVYGITDDGESRADEWMDGEDIPPQLSALTSGLIPAIKGR